MKQNNISYLKGITRSPSDLLCSDGELAECINLEVKNQEIVPMDLPNELSISLDNNEKLLYIHTISPNIKNFITSTPNGNNVELKFFISSETSFGEKNTIAIVDNIVNIQSVGNTLIIISDTGIYYALFKDSSYKWLGQKPPELVIEFWLQTAIHRSEPFDINTQKMQGGNGIFKFIDDDARNSANTVITANINKFIAQQKDKSYFIYPFFIRYVYKLYDGSYIMQSSPILMIPNTEVAPAAITETLFMSGTAPNTATFYITGMVSGIQYKIINSNLDTLNEWSDIITEVGIFISQPIYSYDQNGEIEELKEASLTKAGQSINYGWDIYNTAPNSYAPHILHELYREYYHPQNTTFIFDGLKKDNFLADIKDTSLFYHIKSLRIIDLDDKSHTLVSIDNSKDYSSILNSLTAKEVLPDDYRSHDQLIPSTSYVYNQRLNIANIKRKIFNGYDSSCICMNILGQETNMYDYFIYTFIKDGSNTKIVRNSCSDKMTEFGQYLYYPDSKAYRMIIVKRTTENSLYCDIQLIKHTSLNGSFFFNNFENLQFTEEKPSDFPEKLSDEISEEYNKIYTSEVGNPFYFPLNGINTVGIGAIRGLASITTALSQGQFGQFPLIAFSDDGIWAMEINNEGLYSSIRPMSREICSNPKSITQTDNAVLFITEKGLMAINGPIINNLSETMDGQHYRISALTHASSKIPEFISLINNADDKEGFIRYINNAITTYDYTGKRIILSHPNKTYSYVYSLESSTFSKMVLPGKSFITSVSDYPDSIMQDNSGKLYSLYKKVDRNIVADRKYGFIVTRPLKLGDPLTLKNIFQLKNIGHFSTDSYIRYAMYGSNDGIGYNRIHSKHGKPFKYYRFIIYSKLLPKEYFSGTIVISQQRRDNKIR